MSRPKPKAFVLKARKELIFLLYRHFVVAQTILTTKQMFIDWCQANASEQYQTHYLKLFDQLHDLQKLVEQHLDPSWTWSRINNLYKAVLIVGCFEITNIRIDKAVVIDQMLNFIHKYDADNYSEFINSVLDKID